MKQLEIIDTVTGDIYSGVSLSGTFNLGGRMACFKGTLVNGCKVYVKTKEPMKKEEVFVDLLDGVDNKIMYIEPSEIKSMTMREQILEFCEKYKLHRAVDTTVGTSKIIEPILEPRTKVKAQRIVQL